MITHETNEPEYCTIAEAAEMLRVSKPTVRRWIASNRLRVVRISPRILRIRRTDVHGLALPHQAGRPLTRAELEPYMLHRPAPRHSRAESDAVIAEINRRILARNGGKQLESSLPLIHEQRR